MLRFTRLVNRLGREGGNRIYRSWRVCSTPPRDNLYSLSQLCGPGFPPFLHMFKAPGLCIPTGTQYGVLAITKVNPSLHFQSWQGQRWRRTLAGLQKHEPPFERPVNHIQSVKSNWKGSELWTLGFSSSPSVPTVGELTPLQILYRFNHFLSVH